VIWKTARFMGWLSAAQSAILTLARGERKQFATDSSLMPQMN
jgi:hypothetical protein